MHSLRPRARFPEANARINYEPCSNRRTEERPRRRSERNRGGGDGGHPYYGRSRDTPCLPQFHVPLFLPLLAPRAPAVPPFLFPTPRLCLTSVAKFFRPATIIAPWRSRRWRRKTGVGFARPSYVEMQRVNVRDGEESKPIDVFDGRSSDGPRSSRVF